MVYKWEVKSCTKTNSKESWTLHSVFILLWSGVSYIIMRYFECAELTQERNHQEENWRVWFCLNEQHANLNEWIVYDINMKRWLAPLLLNHSSRGTGSQLVVSLISSGLLWLSSCLVEVWEVLFFGLCPSFSLRLSERPQAWITFRMLHLITLFGLFGFFFKQWSWA